NEKVTSLRPLDAFERIVLTCGAWVTKFIDLPLTVTLQTYGYVDQEMHGPVWIECMGDHMYGFATEPDRPEEERQPGQSAKIGYHTPGRVTVPESPDRPAQPAALDAVLECAHRRFGLESPRIVEAGTCLYTIAPNDDFQIGWADERVLFASPCSGHG